MEYFTKSPIPLVWGQGEALIHGDRILSCYQVGGGNRIYIITEADRQSTSVLLSEEY